MYRWYQDDMRIVGVLYVCVPEDMGPWNTQLGVRVWVAWGIEDAETHGCRPLSHKCVDGNGSCFVPAKEFTNLKVFVIFTFIFSNSYPSLVA
jgi:hypothetical protein